MEVEIEKEKDERRIAIDTLVKAAIKGEEFEEALGAAELGASSEIIDLLFKTRLEKEGIVEARKIVKLGVSHPTIDKLAEYYLEEAQKLEEAVKQDEGKYDEMTKNFNLAVEVASLGASQEVKDLIMKDLVRSFLKQEAEDLDYLYSVAQKLYGETPVPQEIINPLINDEIDTGWILEAKQLAELRKKPLTTEEIKRLAEGFKKR